MRIIISVCLTLLFIPSICFAKPIEIRTDNFIIAGDVGEKDGQALLRDLELFRKNMFKLLGVNEQPEIIPVKVYIAKNGKALKGITGVGGFGGMYTMTHTGPAFVLDGKNGFKRGGGARHIALHEYSHHIVSAYTELDYPLWYNEGYANYLATFTYKKGTFRVGDPYDPYARSLKQKNWMPMTVILSSVEKYPFNLGDTSKVGLQTKAQFYAQTWLAMHYLKNEAKYKGALTDYVRRLNKGERSLPAFKAATGLTPEEFEAELKAYFKKNRYSVTRFTTTDRDIPTPIVTKLTKQQVELVKLNAMKKFAFTDARRSEVLKAFDAYEAKYGVSAETLTGRADLLAYNASTKEDYMSARAIIDKALELDPENADANAVAAMIIVHQKGRNLGATSSDMKQARNYAKKALAQDSQMPLANYVYALSFNGEGRPPKSALNAANYALDYYRDKGFMGSNLGLASVLMNGEQYSDAIKPINRAISWGKDPAMRMAAQSMRKYIEGETTP